MLEPSNPFPFRLARRSLFLIGIALVAVFSGTPHATSVDRRPPIELTPLERAFVMGQVAGGKDRVQLLIVASPGRSADIAKKLTEVSGEVVELEEDIDFVRGWVPIAHVPEVMQWPELTTAQIETRQNGFDQLLTALANSNSSQQSSPKTKAQPDSTTKTAADGSSRGTPPTAYTARDNPYTAESATESIQFKTEHPTYDGRGVTIGGLDGGGINPRTPSLTWALSIEGARVSKLLDYLMLPPSTDIVAPAIPVEDRRQPYGWQRTIIVGPDGRGRVTFNGVIFTIPVQARSGELRMTQYRIRVAGVLSELTVLWAVRRGEVWICEKGQVDFSVVTPMKLISSESGNPWVMTQFGKNEWRTLRLAVDLPNRTVGLNLSAATHSTMCASVAAGHSFLNSQAEGVAPAARILAVDTADTNALAIRTMEGVMALFRDSRVDLITMSAGEGGNSRRRQADQRLVNWQIFDRLQAKYPKPLLMAAGNNAPHGDSGFGSRASGSVITIGAYTPLETWQTNFGITPSAKYTPASYSDFGPALDGGLKPELLSLTGTLCAANEEGPSEKSFFALPEGYEISGGTSAATPNAAGHAALLISAAKQSGIPYDPARLKMALFSSAKFLDGVEARQQGHGLVQVGQAWEALQKLKNHTPLTFTTQASVRTFYSAQLATPNVGRGIFETIGWDPNRSGYREIIITRTSGPSEPITYQLRWHETPVNSFAANDTPNTQNRNTVANEEMTKAFSSSMTQITLLLNQPVKLPVHIEVGPSGAYSAILDLIDPSVGLVAHSVMCVVIAAEQLTPEARYTTTVRRAAPHPGTGFLFVNVPPGASALRVQVKQNNGKSVVLGARMPDGQEPKIGMSKENGNYGAAGWELRASGRETYDQTFIHPQAGVWRFWITHDNARWPNPYDPALLSRPAPACEFTMQVTALGMESAARTGTAANGTVSFRNTFTPVDKAKVVPIGLGSARSEQLTLKPGLSPLFYDIEIEPGTLKLEADVEAVTPGTANISLIFFYLTNGAKDPVSTVAYDMGPGARKHVELTNPVPGKYKICLDAWGEIPAGGLKVRYRDAVFHPLYGKLSVDDKTRRLDVGGTHIAKLSWDVQARPVDGRQLIAEVGLFSDDCVNMKFDSAKWSELANKARKEGKTDPPPDITAEAVPIATHTLLLPRH